MVWQYVWKYLLNPEYQDYACRRIRIWVSNMIKFSITKIEGHLKY
jgi:hypothetical protein